LNFHISLNVTLQSGLAFHAISRSSTRNTCISFPRRFYLNKPLFIALHLCCIFTFRIKHKVHRKISTLQGVKADDCLLEHDLYIGFKVFTAVAMKYGFFWDVTSCGSCKNRIPFLRSVRRLLVTASVVPSSPSLVTLMMEALSSSETSVLTKSHTA
jgi:hypothetical protein